MIAILQAKLSGGRNQPRVWLRPDTVVNATHTFERERGVLGGEVIPFIAIHGDRIFSPKREEALAFLESFRLDRAEAERVVNAVGAAP